MAHYRAYFIGGDGHFIKSTDIIAEDDPAAIIAARSLIGKYAIELWEHDRRIMQFDVFKVVANTTSGLPQATP